MVMMMMMTTMMTMMMMMMMMIHCGEFFFSLDSDLCPQDDEQLYELYVQSLQGKYRAHLKWPLLINYGINQQHQGLLAHHGMQWD